MSRTNEYYSRMARADQRRGEALTRRILAMINLGRAATVHTTKNYGLKEYSRCECRLGGDIRPDPIGKEGVMIDSASLPMDLRGYPTTECRTGGEMRADPC
jgi:hypothetical protein